MKAIIENGKINDGIQSCFISEYGVGIVFHNIDLNDIAWCKADGIRNDHYIIKLNVIVLAVEKGDESLDIRAEW